MKSLRPCRKLRGYVSCRDLGADYYLTHDFLGVQHSRCAPETCRATQSTISRHMKAVASPPVVRREANYANLQNDIGGRTGLSKARTSCQDSDVASCQLTWKGLADSLEPIKASSGLLTFHHLLTFMPSH